MSSGDKICFVVMVVESKVFFIMSVEDMICFVVFMLQTKDSAEVKNLNVKWSVKQSVNVYRVKQVLKCNVNMPSQGSKARLFL